MATVYLATDLKHKRSVALKVLHPELAQSLGPLRFQREIELAARLQHPHILTVHDSGETAGKLWFYACRSSRANRCATGSSARSSCRWKTRSRSPARPRRRWSMPTSMALSIGTSSRRTFCSPPTAAPWWRTSVWPRRWTRGEERITSTGFAVGTPAYMSPEQAAGERVLGAATDVYSLGCVLYEMLVGEPPFTGPTSQAILAKRLSGEIPRVRVVRPSVAVALERAVTRALAPVPADRFASAADFGRALAAAGSSASTEVQPAMRAGSRRFPARLLGGATVALVLAAGLGLWWALSRPHVPRHGVQRIALLPLANTTGDSSQTFVADGLTREVISALTSSGVRVIGYASASHYGPDVPLEKVARELGVDAIAVGALRRTSPRLQVTLELTDPASRENLWAETYTVDTSEMSVVASRAAQGLAGVVRGQAPRPGKSPYPRAPSRAPPNRNAYAEFLLGRQSAAGWTPEAYRRTVDHYSRAIALDSGFAAAWGGLAGVHAYYAPYFDWVPREAYDQAKAAAERALSLDPTVGEAHLALALLKQFRDWDWAGAEQEFRRAIELEPSSTAQDAYAWFLVAIGRFPEAVTSGERTVQIDPTNAPFHASLSSLLREAGHPDRAVDEAKTAIELDSTHVEGWLSLAWSSALLGRVQEATAAFDRYEALFGDARPLERVVLYANGGRKREARALLIQEERKVSGKATPVFFDAAKAHSLLGDKERALDMLEDATKRREFWWPYFIVWDPIRSDPEVW